MRFFVGITDRDWFDFLFRLNGVDEVRLGMGRYITTALLKNGHYRGHAFLELGHIYFVQFCHHHIRRVPLNDPLEHFMLDYDLAESPQFFVPFLDQGCFDFPLLFLSAVNQLFDSRGNLRDCIHARM